MYCGMFSSILGLCLLDGNSNPPLVTIKNIQEISKYLLGRKIPCLKITVLKNFFRASVVKNFPAKQEMQETWA